MIGYIILSILTVYTGCQAQTALNIIQCGLCCQAVYCCPVSHSSPLPADLLHTGSLLHASKILATQCINRLVRGLPGTAGSAFPV